MRRTGILSLAAVPLLLLASAGAAVPDAALTVTAPAAGSVHQAGGSVFVTWRNATGQELDMWLVHGDEGRVAQLAAKLGAAPEGETATVLPTIVNGEGYAIEMAGRDGAASAFSGEFTVTPQVRAAR
ncbi:Ser-Thr-rich GPI-anchored membrane family protein [Streptomyces sp. VRA16 Mangrove soil]|uniref:Ser-Thr-rich GPI-anchored membrane family protein n=1 Tax=Streptomyces sp. VRA16 Mangrove soil TaxID=2817434 RepID=UPI001A9F1271|nr:Ser-Thr-rich GPI-anchored membrane family protein [Streptomyces sp. VRA16 Mangrove soil]MBO1332860.1 hypothetical protein [Streptomyces sp. VRA16 Mangrove soil]